MVQSGNRNASKTRGDDYWTAARSPLCCLIFLIPLLAAYEVGIIWLGGTNPEFLRNGADYWMRVWLEQQGSPLPWLLPFLVVATLLSWQVAGKFPYTCRLETLVGMAAESLLFACVLLLLAQGQEWLFRTYFGPVDLAITNRALAYPSLARIVSFLGAGIYEEVLFRLLAIPVAQVAFRVLLVPPRYTLSASILATSLLFSLAHYLGPAADTFSTYSFLFRSLAGVFFALLFVIRGFGITVGAHAGYDLLVGVLLKSAA
ncbi:MAG: amino terminal protease self-immunity [Planctomycetaceae bacterium]|nr:amino terminal protease self-immunity [Planctomycetaceae bacterium]